MSKKVLIRKEAGGGIMYTRDIGRGQGGGFRQDLAALRGGAMGLNPQGGQSFIPGAQLPGAAPTRMQRLGAGANLAGRGLAAALTGLQTAYGLQGGNVGALGSVGDTYAQNVQGLTANRPTEAQQTQDMATEAFNQQQQTMAQNAMMQQATPPRQGNLTVGVAPPTYGSSSATPATQPPANLPTPPVPAQTPPANLPTPPADHMQQTPPIQPVASEQPVSPEIIQATHGSVQPMYNQEEPTSTANPLQPASLTHYQGTINPATGQPYPVLRSFVEQVLNEFGDMLHKADPHVAGLLAFRVYMDKVMR